MFAEPPASVFFADHGVNATLAGQAVRGYFSAAYAEPLGNAVASSAPAFELPAAAAPGAATGQALIVGGNTYLVRAIEPDETGAILLLRLELQ
jgi:hypothetical protein